MFIFYLTTNGGTLILPYEPEHPNTRNFWSDRIPNDRPYSGVQPFVGISYHSFPLPPTGSNPQSKIPIHFPIIETHSITCSRLINNGGANLILSPWVGLANSPLSFR